MKTRASFTLLEIVLVLALIMVILGMVYPSLEAMYSDYKITAAGDQVRGAWASARARAMEDVRPYRFTVMSGKSDYRVAPDNPEFWKGGEPPTAPDSVKPPLVLEASLPKGIVFSTP